MKTQILFLLLIVATLLSCGKDDNNEISESRLAGDWYMISYEYSGVQTSVYDFNTPYTHDITGVAQDITHTVTFSENPNTYESFGGYIMKETSSTEGIGLIPPNSSTNFYDFEDFEFDDTWSMEGSTIRGFDYFTIPFTEPVATYEVAELTDSRLKIKYIFDRSLGEFDGVEIGIYLEAEMVFGRQ